MEDNPQLQHRRYVSQRVISKNEVCSTFFLLGRETLYEVALDCLIELHDGTLIREVEFHQEWESESMLPASILVDVSPLTADEMKMFTTDAGLALPPHDSASTFEADIRQTFANLVAITPPSPSASADSPHSSAAAAL